MTNNQIKYMIEIAKTGSINQDAKNLFISQSALSNAISSVENEFNRRIFYRTSKGVSLTSFGKLFIAYITPIDKQLDQLYTMRGDGIGIDTPSLTIISNGFFYLSLIASTIGERHKSSGIKIHLIEDYSGDIVDPIVSGEADLAIVRLWSCYKENNLDRYTAMKLLYHPICQMDIGVDIGENSPLYSYQNDSIATEELQDFPQIVHECLDCGPYGDILNRLKIPCNSTKYIVNSRAAIYELLNSTQGYVLNSRKANAPIETLNPCSKYKGRFIPLKDCPIYSEIGWIVKESAPITSLVKEFIHLLTDYLLKDIS